MKNKEEKKKTEVILSCLRGEIKAYQAASVLRVSVRQVEKLKAKVRRGQSLIHGNCGRKSGRATPKEIIEKILSEYQNPLYKGINFAHFTELLNEDKHVASYSTVAKVLKKHGFVSPKAKRNPKKVHKTRERRIKYGELLQGDGTEFEWFRNLGITEKYVIHGLIDDATGRVIALYMSKHECLHGFLEVLRYTLQEHGIPMSLYLDGSSVFFSHKRDELTIEEELSGIQERKTRFGEICDYLGIEIIRAHSSQAKGRVERLWETLQSRLPIEFARRGIKTAEAANAFFPDFIETLNGRFALVGDFESDFVPLPVSVNLDELLCYKEQRTVLKGGVISLKNIKFSVVGLDKIGAQLEILISKRLGVIAKYADKFYELRPIEWQKKSINSSDSAEMILNRFVHFYTLKDEHAIRISA